MHALKVNALQQFKFCRRLLYSFNFTLIDTGLRVNKNESTEPEDQAKHLRIPAESPLRVPVAAIRP